RGLGKVPRLADLVRQKAEEAAARRAPAAPPPDPDGGAGGVERRVGSSVFGLRATVARGTTRGIPCLVFLRSYEAGFILEIGMNLLLGMRRGDGVDLLDDDLLEEFLDLGVGLLMLGPGHQAAVIEAMQQVIDRLPAQADAEFLLQDA